MVVLRLKAIEQGDKTLLPWELTTKTTETAGLLGTGAQDGHLDSHTAPELCCHLIIYTVT